MLFAFFTTPVQDTVARVSAESYHFFTAAIAVGLLSMAIIQMFKDILPVRRWFQRSWVQKWLRLKRSAEYLAAEKDLVQLATDGDYNSFYNLPIEQLCGQANAAAQAALDNPKMHALLLRCLGSEADPNDLSTIIGGPPPEARKPRAQFAPDDPSLGRVDDYVDARNRVAHQIQRAIDSLQVSAGQRWKFWIQLLSMAISLIIACLGVSFFGELYGWQRVETIIAVALLGGFFAPIARDLIAGLQQLRN